MQLAFSTLGCPTWGFEKVVTCASALGYDAVEIRGIEGEMDLTKIDAFQPKAIKKSVDHLENMGVRICCLGSSSSFHHTDREERRKHVEAAEAVIRLADELSCPFVRVFGDKIPDPAQKKETIRLVVEALKELGDYAADYRVKVVMETHGDFCATGDVQDVMERVSHKHVGVLWDTHHPYRLLGENPRSTANRLGEWIWHTHFKDSVRTDGGYRYVLMGEGDVPVPDILGHLSRMGYKGCLSLEWEKAWCPKIEPPEIAIPDYIRKMKAYLAQVAKDAEYD